MAFLIGYGASSQKDRKGKVAMEMHKKLVAREENGQTVGHPAADARPMARQAKSEGAGLTVRGGVEAGHR